MDVDEFEWIVWRKFNLYGREFKTPRGCFAYKIRSTAIGYGKHDPTFDMSELWDELLGSDRNDKGVSCMAKFYNIIECNLESPAMLPGLQDLLYLASAK